MRKQFFWAIFIVFAAIFAGCEKDSDLAAHIPSVEGEEEQFDLYSSEWDLQIGEMEETPEGEEVNSTPIGLRNSSNRIFNRVKSLGKGQKYQVYIKKQHLHPDYRYVCKVSPSSGDPDLYVLGRYTRRNRWRLLRKSENQGKTVETSYGQRSDLSNSEDRLYFLVKARQSGRFQIEIFKEKAAGDVECVDYKDNFDDRKILRIAVQSKRWISYDPEDPDPEHSPHVRVNPRGAGRILELHTRQPPGVFAFSQPWRNGIYRIKMDLYFEPGSQFKADFYADYEFRADLVNVTIGKDMVDIGQNQVCANRSAPVPRTQGWVKAEILYNDFRREMTLELDDGRVKVSRKISLDEPFRFVKFQATALPGSPDGHVHMDNLAIEILAGCD